MIQNLFGMLLAVRNSITTIGKSFLNEKVILTSVKRNLNCSSNLNKSRIVNKYQVENDENGIF
jgi:hypothetical protein